MSGLCGVTPPMNIFITALNSVGAFTGDFADTFEFLQNPEQRAIKASYSLSCAFGLK